MFAQLTSGLDLHANALVLRAQRQHAIASNIANADTPGYVAQDINFKQAMAAAQGHTSLTLRPPVSAAGQTTHAAHLPLRAGNPASELASAGRAYTVQTQPSMDNNTVDLDRERANFVDNAVRYESTLRFINGYSRTILSAISGQ